jgi:tetratricopeptide (TPR) repeat protein
MNSDQMLKYMADYEKDLSRLLKNVEVHDKKVSNLVGRISKMYEKLIIENQMVASSNAVEISLWKNVYYRVIEEYRKKFRQLEMSEEQNLGDLSLEQISQLRNIQNFFKSFLLEASNFYVSLIRRICMEKNMNFVWDIICNSVDGAESWLYALSFNDVSQKKYLITIHRSVIYLGDLARYREQKSLGTKKEFREILHYYDVAIKLLPFNGNPYNQLAVISSHISDDLSACYFYYRSLLTIDPFPTAKENLVLLYQKNEKLFKSGKKRKGISVPINDFFSDFLLIHFKLFQPESANCQSNHSELHSRVTLKFQELDISESMMLKIFCVNIAELTSCIAEDRIGSRREILLLLIDMYLLALDKNITLPSLRLMLISFICFAEEFKPIKDSTKWQNLAKKVCSCVNSLSLKWDPAAGDCSVVWEEDFVYNFIGFSPLSSWYSNANLSNVSSTLHERSQHILGIMKRIADGRMFGIFCDTTGGIQLTFSCNETLLPIMSTKKVFNFNDDNKGGATTSPFSFKNLPDVEMKLGGLNLGVSSTPIKQVDKFNAFKSKLQGNKQLQQIVTVENNEYNGGISSPVGMERHQKNNNLLSPDNCQNFLWNYFSTSPVNPFFNNMVFDHHVEENKYNNNKSPVENTSLTHLGSSFYGMEQMHHLQAPPLPSPPVQNIPKFSPKKKEIQGPFSGNPLEWFQEAQATDTNFPFHFNNV